MDGLSSMQTLQALSSLLSKRDEYDDEDSEIVQASAKLCPGNIGPPASSHKQSKEGSSAYAKQNSKAIWDEDEVPEVAQFDDLTDPRPEPEYDCVSVFLLAVIVTVHIRYDIILKQSVGTEDLFLGMSRKDPSSMCCEGMLVRVKLPDTKASEVVLDVKEQFLDLRTPKYKLGLHLPQPVHPREGTARFISERAELEITLLMHRPMDCINLA
ncbi:protein PIH1D3 isoform X1 [Alosa alosa]|uniref:protein PIH1D3 isoform X1 n=1 Tax=Alosa alosa TaxID=278164 RepID=UPI0020153F1D|nr:protein PIH1D3 isoform X1 [Alosa alosa]